VRSFFVKIDPSTRIGRSRSSALGDEIRAVDRRRAIDGPIDQLAPKALHVTLGLAGSGAAAREARGATGAADISSTMRQTVASRTVGRGVCRAAISTATSATSDPIERLVTNPGHVSSDAMLSAPPGILSRRRVATHGVDEHRPQP
jgi:hypothetical protein